MAELDQVYAKQYGANVYMTAQQKGSRLRNYVTVVDMQGERRFFERSKPTSAFRIDSLYTDTPLLHSEFDRRAITATEYGCADLIDWQQKLNLLIDPTSPIVQQIGFALGRVIDDIILDCGFDGFAYEGKEGLTPVAYPASQQIAVTVGGTGGANTGLNIEKLRQARSLFGKADIDLDDPSNTLYMAVTQAQLDDLLRTTEVTSSDYNIVKALVDGVVKKFMGFEFVQTERLRKDENTIRKCCAWCKSGVYLALPQDITMEVNQRPDKNNAWQALGKLKAGATRIEDIKTAQIFCAE